MPKKTKERKQKKIYRRPQVNKVKLVVDEALQQNCKSTTSGSPGYDPCYISAAEKCKISGT